MRAPTTLLLLTSLAGCSECTPPPPAPPPPAGEGEGEGEGDAAEGEGEGEGEGDAAEGEGEGEGDGEPTNACLPLDVAPPFQISAHAELRWKRARAVENDLGRALQLSAQEICGEVGFGGICFNLAHQVPLGGNDAVNFSMFKPIAEPSVTTPIALDRVAIAACGKRVDLDSSALALPVFFTDLDLALASVDPSTPGIDATTTKLYRALLARDPTPTELQTAASLAEPVDGIPLSARDLAKTLCYAVATTSEFLFD